MNQTQGTFKGPSDKGTNQGCLNPETAPKEGLNSRLETLHAANLEQMIKLMCSFFGDILRVFEGEASSQVLLQENLKISSFCKESDVMDMKDIVTELKFSDKIREEQSRVSLQIDQLLGRVIKLFLKDSSKLPKISRLSKIQGGSGELSTITEKESEDNLLQHFLKKSQKTRKKSPAFNLPSKSQNYNSSSIEQIEYDVIREETRRSLEDPYHNSEHRKSLYKDLQRDRGRDTILPSVKNYLEKHKKAIGAVPKLPNYQINKFI